jgi:hypothetical protein
MSTIIFSALSTVSENGYYSAARHCEARAWVAIHPASGMQHPKQVEIRNGRQIKRARVPTARKGFARSVKNSIKSVQMATPVEKNTVKRF